VTDLTSYVPLVRMYLSRRRSYGRVVDGGVQSTDFVAILRAVLAFDRVLMNL
jgi:hypothetical protein